MTFTDDELTRIDCEPGEGLGRHALHELATQAREANALRAEVDRLREYQIAADREVKRLSMENADLKRTIDNLVYPRSAS